MLGFTMRVRGGHEILKILAATNFNNSTVLIDIFFFSELLLKKILEM